MAEKTSYIRVDRNIVKWRWWHHHNTLVVFLYLILSANVVDHDFEGVTIHRGEIATSLEKLSASCNLTIRQVRTAITHLKSTGEVTSRTYPRFQVITIVGYDKYQDLTGKTPYKRQGSDKQATSKRQQYENIENIENERRKGRSAPSAPPGQNQGRMPDRDKGTDKDIPAMYREQFADYAAYWDWRNQ